MPYSVFIDGHAGTTGLELAARLSGHVGIESLAIEDRFRKDAGRRKELFEQADVVALCLPDDAAREAVELRPATRFLDASTAHRTSADWTYGLPELGPGQREAIRASARVANPGCYPTGFVLGIRPLVEAGLLSPDLPLRLHAVSGYSGGGKTLIAKYEACDAPALRSRPYGLTLAHKHVPEMHRYAKLDAAPLFSPRGRPLLPRHAGAGRPVHARVGTRRDTDGRAARAGEPLPGRAVRPRSRLACHGNA